MKWFACTPVDFQGGEAFFSRDSGLLSRGFREIGVESRAVVTGRRRPDDLEELIRTDHGNLVSPDWWRAHDLDGVVLYAWGRPRFRRVAEAIHRAGVRLVLNQDSGGLVSPRCGWKDWWREQRNVSGAGRMPGGLRRQVSLVVRGLTLGLWVTDPLRARHLGYGDRIAAVSPRAAEHYRTLAERYLAPGLVERVVFVPHPVAPLFTPGGESREARVVAVGRWDDERQKRTSLLVGVVGRVLAEHSSAEFDIVGTAAPDLRAWHRKMGPADRDRVRLHGRIPPAGIRSLLRRARVSYCPSAFESFHIASGEALCCGCSVVAGRSVSLASFEWFVGDGDGRLAETDDLMGHVEALLGELEAWEDGMRDPKEIAGRWSERLHAPRVAEGILRLFPDLVPVR